MPHPDPPDPSRRDALPPPDPQAAARIERLTALIRSEARGAGGEIPFDRFMELALYAPGLGYYTGGAPKLGPEGDFVTAPEISPLFSRCLAAQSAQVLEALDGGDILELGAGSGVLAADLLAELESMQCLPQRYLILELGAELRERQRALIRERVPHLSDRVAWLERMPAQPIRGVVLANEVVDAMPVSRFRIAEHGPEEQFVADAGEGLALQWGSVRTPGLEQAVRRLTEDLGGLPLGYESEINLRAGPWVRLISESLSAGLILVLDYGYPRREYYHPQRSGGTLTCHYRHRAHFDPLFAVGEQDLTANVDFTLLAEAAAQAGLAVRGYTTQGHFLLGLGVDRFLSPEDSADASVRLRQAQELKVLTMPSEMGERFKVLALARGLDIAPAGFGFRDLRDRL